jgi:hypothetical protein
MLDDRGFYVIVLWSGRSDSYDEKINILERANFICILYEFYVKIVYAFCVILMKKLCILKTSLALRSNR